MSLVAHDLEYAYRTGAPVLRGLSATFATGRLTAVVGPNGCGKSTLLRALLGSIAPARGRVTLDGVDVRSLHGRALASRIGFLAQRGTSSLASALTVRQSVALGRFARGASPAGVDEALDLAGLRGLEGALVSTLSAGQQQRVALARVAAQMHPIAPQRGAEIEAAVATPVAPPAPTRVVLADEPASHLDPGHALHTLGTLRGWARAGLCVVVVMHDVSLALRLADEVLVLSGEGRAVVQGPPEDALAPAVLERVFGVPFARVGAAPRVALVAGGGGEQRE